MSRCSNGWLASFAALMLCAGSTVRNVFSGGSGFVTSAKAPMKPRASTAPRPLAVMATAEPRTIGRNRSASWRAFSRIAASPGDVTRFTTQNAEHLPPSRARKSA